MGLGPVGVPDGVIRIERVSLAATATEEVSIPLVVVSSVLVPEMVRDKVLETLPLMLIWTSHDFEDPGAVPALTYRLLSLPAAGTYRRVILASAALFAGLVGAYKV